MPDYYRSFECLGGPCPDNCCIGDELVLDEDTYRLYMAVPGPFGDRLRAVLERAERIGADDPDPDMPGDPDPETSGDPCPEPTGTFEYCLDVDGRCPFLNEDNYCSVVLALGPDSLGEVCATFPRTEDVFAGALEKDLMIACPEAARLLLTHEGPVEYPETGESPLPPVTGSEAELCGLRKALLDVLSDRSLSMDARLLKAAGLCGLKEICLPKPEELPAILEALPWQHRVWPEAFASLCRYGAGETLPDGMTLLKSSFEEAPDAQEHLLSYFIFRYLPWADEPADAAGPFLSAVFSVRVINSLALALAGENHKTPALADLIKAASIWSKELEFSEENILYLFECLTFNALQ